jgi:hypothetical protein
MGNSRSKKGLSPSEVLRTNVQTIYGIQTKIEKYHYLFIVLEESSDYSPIVHPMKNTMKITTMKNTKKRYRMKKSTNPITPGQQKPDPHVIGGRLHEIIKASAPVLSPKLWYGMPAYAKDSKVVCFFQGMEKFRTRYATFGFMHEANLDEGNMWPTAFALKKVTAAEEEKIAALVKKAVS